MLGSNYWQAQGASVIASEVAVEDQRDRGSFQLSMLSQLIGNALDGTEPSYADVTFAENYTLELAGLRFEIVHPGPAHTPGDSFVLANAQGVAAVPLPAGLVLLATALAGLGFAGWRAGGAFRVGSSAG